MNSINNILVPIDFSDNSLKALGYACKLARQVNAKLHVIHAYRLIRPDNLVNNSKGAALKMELENSLNLKFKELEYEYLVSQPIAYDLELAVGFAIDVIQTSIADKKIDLIVMGTRGRRELEEVFGSTTWSVIKSTNCPVLAVPGDVELESVKHIILANENQENDISKSLGIVSHIANSFNSDIMVLKCRRDNDKEDPNLENKSLYQGVFEGLEVKNQFCNNKKFIEGIKQQINKYKNNLLVLMPKENVFMESYFRRENLKETILDTKVPVLMIQKPLVEDI